VLLPGFDVPEELGEKWAKPPPATAKGEKNGKEALNRRPGVKKIVE
jgi:hypothetical protein